MDQRINLLAALATILGCGTAAPQVDPPWSCKNDLEEICGDDCGKVSFVQWSAAPNRGITIVEAGNCAPYVLKENAYQSIPSPDGKLFLYENEDGNITLMTETGEEIYETPINVKGPIEDSHYIFKPEWKSDSSSFAYMITGQIHKFDLKSKEDKTLSQGMSPTWCNDRIIFRMYSENAAENGIYGMDEDGTNINRLREFGHHPTCSPDGTKIALESNKTIWLMDADGSDLYEVTSQLSDKTEKHENVRWSPDGKHFLFNTYRIESLLGGGVTSTDYNLRTADLEPGEQKIISQEYHSKEGTWSPDSRFITYGSRNSIQIFDTKDKQIRGQIHFDGFMHNLFWSP